MNRAEQPLWTVGTLGWAAVPFVVYLGGIVAYGVFTDGREAAAPVVFYGLIVGSPLTLMAWGVAVGLSHLIRRSTSWSLAAVMASGAFVGWVLLAAVILLTALGGAPEPMDRGAWKFLGISVAIPAALGMLAAGIAGHRMDRRTVGATGAGRPGAADRHPGAGRDRRAGRGQLSAG